MKKPFLAFLSILFASGLLHAQDLGLLTYNIRYDTESDGENRWENRKDFLIGQLQFYRPAIFGTQEGLIHQLQAIRDGMEGYAFVGKGRDDGGEEGEFSALFYHKGTVNLLESQTFWLSETPDTPSLGWDAAIKRVCTYGLFELRETGKKFYVFNTHLDHMGEMARTESVKLLLREIDRINKSKLPVVLMGDFNLEPEHEAIRQLSEKMDDSRILAGENAFGPEGTFNSFSVTMPVGRRIDYLFLSPGDFKLHRYAVLTATQEGRHPSDHFPVYVDVSIE